MESKAVIEAGMGDASNGVFVRTTGMGQPVFFVSARDGVEMVLDATQILKDIGWAPVSDNARDDAASAA